MNKFNLYFCSGASRHLFKRWKAFPSLNRKEIFDMWVYFFSYESIKNRVKLFSFKYTQFVHCLTDLERILEEDKAFFFYCFKIKIAKGIGFHESSGLLVCTQWVCYLPDFLSFKRDNDLLVSIYKPGWCNRSSMLKYLITYLFKHKFYMLFF